MFRRFEDGSVAGGQRADQRAQRELERVVPGPDHQNATQWFWDDLGPSRTKRQRHIDRPRPHPATEVLTGQFQLLAQSNDFEECFGWWFTQIRLQRGQHLVFMAVEQGLQALQLSQAPRQWSGHATPDALLHPLELMVAEAQGADVLARRV